MVTFVRPSIEKRTYTIGPIFFVRTICGMLVSRPLAGEALALFEEQERQWREVVPSSDPSRQTDGHSELALRMAEKGIR
jgi:hypothetical protein